MTSLSSYLEKLKRRYLSLSVQRVFLVWTLVGLSALFLLLSVISFNSHLVISIPKRGGEIHEGILGTPRFINPVLASNSQDEDLTKLIFSGLTKINTENNVILDSAQSIEKSDDDLNYTVTLKNNIYFHNGDHLTSDDVLYTISLIQDPRLKSPEKIKWEGVKAEKISDYKIVFTLKQPYPLFDRALSVGILPKNVWKKLSPEEIVQSDQNINAIGSGPYKIDTVTRISGIAREFALSEYKHYSLGRPYLSRLYIHSYQNEKLLLQAFDSQEIDTFALVGHEPKFMSPPKKLAKYSMTLPQTYSVFLNPNRAPFLADKDIRKALDLSLHKSELVQKVFGDSAEAAYSHFPFYAHKKIHDEEEAASLIARSNFKKKNASSTLAITLTVGNSDDSRELAEIIKERFESVGVRTDIQTFEYPDLNQRIIKRDFQAILSGTELEDPSDLYAFWHSSQRTSPGLNISSYVSSKLDKNLEELRNESDRGRRVQLTESIEDELKEETPAIFLYHPKLVYYTKNNLTLSFPVNGISESSRYSDIEHWYLQTEKVWKFSYKQKIISFIEGILH